MNTVVNTVLLASIFTFMQVCVAALKASDFSSMQCSSAADCTSLHKNALCANKDAATNPGTNSRPTDLRCACNSDQNWHFDSNNGKCIYQATIGDVCESSVATCAVKNSTCSFDDSNTGLKRCRCPDGKLEAKYNNEVVCADIITQNDDQACTQCETNEGRCYDASGNMEYDGCVCPASRSGQNCTQIHVFVKCTVDNFNMRICYEPHPGFDLKASSGIHTDGYGNDEACRGQPSDQVCGAGMYILNLPLSENGRKRCGTKRFIDVTNVKYISKIVVSRKQGQSSVDDLVFKTFCSFQTHAAASFNGIGVVGEPFNDRGEEKNGDIEMIIENLIGAEIPSGVAIRLGDDVRFRLKLKDDGTFTAMKLLRCTASDAPNLPSHRAVTLQLIDDGCPTKDQEVITELNNWRRYQGKMNELETGLIKMFKMQQGDSVFLHCAVKLCLQGHEQDCAPKNCSWPSEHMSAGRRKRATGDSSVEDVSREIITYSGDHEAPDGFIQMSASGFAALMVILVLILLLLGLLSSGLLYKIHRYRQKSMDSIHVGDKPQRFVLPRMPRTNQRI